MPGEYLVTNRLTISKLCQSSPSNSVKKSESIITVFNRNVIYWRKVLAACTFRVTIGLLSKLLSICPAVLNYRLTYNQSCIVRSLTLSDWCSSLDWRILLKDQSGAIFHTTIVATSLLQSSYRWVNIITHRTKWVGKNIIFTSATKISAFAVLNRHHFSRHLVGWSVRIVTFEFHIDSFRWLRSTAFVRMSTCSTVFWPIGFHR